MLVADPSRLDAVLTVVSGEPEAQVVCGLLQTNGIDCAYRDTEAIDSPLEDFTAAGRREILVRTEDLEAARALIDTPIDPEAAAGAA